MAVIIFDFDGTIADSFEFVVSFLERHVRRGRELDETEKSLLRGMTMQQMATHLGCPNWRLPLLFVVGRMAMGKAIYNVPLFPGMGRVIEQLHNEGHELAIVSSNNGRNIRKFLKQHHLYKFFTDVYSGAGFFGKQRALARLIRRNNLQPKDAVYIGDESRDISASKAAGIKVIAVSWGFDRADLLAAQQPTGIAHTTQDIVRLIEEL